MTNPQQRQQDVKRIIEECAGNYEKNLLNRYVLFGPTDGSHPYETFFPSECFFHLCGLEYKNKRQKVSAKKFFELALEHRIDAGLFTPKYSRYTALKLSILPRLVRIDGYASKFVFPFPSLIFGKTKAEFAVYNGDVIMGFRMDYAKSKAYVPCTALCKRMPKLHDEKNIGFVKKTRPQTVQSTYQGRPSYIFRSKPKGLLNAQQQSYIRKSESKYHGICMPPYLQT